MIKIDRGNFSSNLHFLKKTGLLDRNKRILEIGSGVGHLVNYLFHEGYQIEGTDVNQEYINFAQREFGLSLSHMNGEKLDYPDQNFDLVLSFDVFEHIPDSNRHLQEVKRVLKPGGYYLLQTPNKFTNAPFGIIKNRSLSKYKEYHCSLHSYWQLKRRFKANGFDLHFLAVPVVNDFFKAKVRKFLGWPGLILIKIINVDKLPMFFKPNFYLVAKKIDEI
jgi:SAM-dependent methyltransferase